MSLSLEVEALESDLNKAKLIIKDLKNDRKENRELKLIIYKLINQGYDTLTKKTQVKIDEIIQFIDNNY